MVMWKWWDTSKGAWGLLAIGLGVGIVLTYISPQVGIPVGGVITAIGAILVVRANRSKTKYDEQLTEQEVQAKRDEYNQRILQLHQSLGGLYFDVKSERMPKTEYQTRIRDCRELASSTGNAMAVGRASSILNLIHLYIQRVKQARKEANADFQIQVIESTFSAQINTELGHLLDEVKDE